ncbi:MAG: SDR family NAD(P)-dependent oxidoreductase [Lachnospiraceae bacterium]|nr:SDR family NAD(P)-dependent oxidoreductase [Lachnospiraceae bacterium]
MNIIIITGASSGLGVEFALQLDNVFHNIDEIWLIARRKKEMLEVAQYLEHTTRVLDMDVTEMAQMERFKELLADKKPVIRMLVNCAGYGIMGEFSASNIGEELGMIDVNCRALTHMTYLCIPYMQKNSRIIQLASSAAFLPQPNFAVYAATKSYVYSFSRALNEELRSKEIYVTAVCPGPVDTPFFDIAEKTGSTLAVKKLTLVRADQVVERAIADSYHRRERSVYSAWIKSFDVVSKVVPHKALLELMRFLK